MKIPIGTNVALSVAMRPASFTEINPTDVKDIQNAFIPRARIHVPPKAVIRITSESDPRGIRPRMIKVGVKRDQTQKIHPFLRIVYNRAPARNVM
jgi:hypothetical protein